MKKSLKGKTVLITAGPTREYFDPVRYISNDSSGQMGYALAEAARDTGAKVVLISGPTNLPKPKKVKFVSVVSADEMYKAALTAAKKADIIICAAAVADYMSTLKSKIKIKKAPPHPNPLPRGGRGNSKQPTLHASRFTLHLKNTPDILKILGQRKKKGQVIVGFALETDNLLKNARKKLIDKKCDIIVANTDENIGRNSGSVVVLNKAGLLQRLKKQSKISLAKKLVNLFPACS